MCASSRVWLVLGSSTLEVGVRVLVEDRKYSQKLSSSVTLVAIVLLLSCLLFSSDLELRIIPSRARVLRASGCLTIRIIALPVYHQSAHSQQPLKWWVASWCGGSPGLLLLSHASDLSQFSIVCWWLLMRHYLTNELEKHNDLQSVVVHHVI